MPGDIEDTLAKMKENYVALLPEKIGAIRSLWEKVSSGKDSENISEIYRMAHTLAGSGSTFGQNLVSKKAKDLENYIKDISKDGFIFNDTHMKEIEDRLKILENSISS